MKKELNKKIRISKNPEDRKQEIIDTALELFAQKGYSNTTIQDIAEYIGVSQGLCYRYFKSKSELFAAASQHYASTAVQQINIPFEENMTSVQKLDFLLHEMYEYIIKSSEFDAIYYSEGQKKVDSEIQLNRLKNFSIQLSNVLGSIIKQGITEKVMDCSDVDNTSKFLAYGMVYTFHMDFDKEDSQLFASNFIISLRDLLINSLQIKNLSKTSKDWFEKDIK